jgi:hypothetical protein
MEDKNKMDQQSGRPNRDQEMEKKPSQGSQDVNRQGQGQQGNVQQGQQGNVQQGQQGNVQQGQQGNVQQGQRDQRDREKKPA